jgi:hypothetical protein
MSTDAGQYPDAGDYPPPSAGGPERPAYPPPPPGYGGYPPPPWVTPPPNTSGYDAFPPQTPAPAGLGGLLQKWIRVTTRPGVASFWNELPTANWRDILLSLLGLGVLEAITSSIAALYMPDVIDIPRANGIVTRVRIPASAHWSSMLTVPIGFLIVVGILFIIGRMFGGRGTVLEQSYALSLFYIPLQGLSAILGLIPLLGGLAAFGLGVYQLVLTVFAIAASQRLTLGRATATVLLPALLLFLVACMFAAVLAALLVGTLR